ncbi:hypothetical protein A3B84_02950 [Candidatus Nomurabacteria bacterium RIFCSPHIGHO2_02_FULL_35_13]|uniref:histidine kinase n=1 Tax=Candidatus Nomurabacteria bacterium RIFCSPHIGHO2_02_FULL_35_13 TaxID=1801748 RepID=A0A1F6VN39_9BACT|nr:MAG: hypothetical protein A3B84_02950 [Candidatus Nomurabacteria bacterium RIFCSPHIGHO2_02_FULL_35_13]
MCQWDTARFLIFSDNVFGTLIYYSHFLALILSFLVGLFVFWKDRKSLVNKLLFLIMFLFSVWVFFDLILWANEKNHFIMFFWSAMLIIEPLIYALCVYFIDVFVEKKDVTFKKKVGIFSLLLPVIILLPTKFALVSFDLTNCFREPVEGFIATYYVYFIEIIYSLWILVYAVRKYRQSIPEMRKQIVLITLGVILFLLSFVSGNIVGSFTENWTLAQIGLFSMPIFVVFLAYMIVKFKTFNIKMFGAQALVFALGFLVLGIIFIRAIENVRAVAAVTLLLIVFVGYLLIKGVKKEIKQKEELARLNINLQELIKQRESLVHLVTHKVKGSFTRSKYIFAGILDGTFGDINDEVKKRAGQGLESDNMGIETVDLVLNAANLEKGTIKYEMKILNFKELVDKTISEKRISAEAKGLKLETEIKEDVYNVSGDSIWLKEVANNLVENSIKYTKEGKITVGLKKEPTSEGKNSKILFYVRDTGVGITSEDKSNLFTEGGRGKESVKINVDSTGYGLYSVRLIVEAHNGKVWMEPNKEEGSGSIFFVELDAQ